MRNSIVSAPRADGLLGRPSLSPEMKSGSTMGFLCFSLGGGEYGMDLNLVRQIVKPPPLTPVPRSAPFVLGIVSIRGAVATLVDLRPLLDMPSTSWPRSARVLLVDHKDEQVGLLVDSVTQVRRLSAAELEKDPELTAGRRFEHLLYVARPHTAQIVVLLDLKTLLEERLG